MHDLSRSGATASDDRAPAPLKESPPTDGADTESAGGTFDVVDPDGATREMVQEAGTPYLGRAGTEHNVINRSQSEAVFVELELKG